MDLRPDREHDLPITRQADILRISRGSVYYLPRPVLDADLAIMRRLDRLHLELPFAGSRMLRGLLAAEGCKVGRRHVTTLMRRMGIEALYRRPRTTKPEPGHKIYPYLLRGVEITRPNQVWAMDISYIPMARGFVYLAVVLDWFSRRVLSWRLYGSFERPAHALAGLLSGSLMKPTTIIEKVEYIGRLWGHMVTGHVSRKRDGEAPSLLSEGLPPPQTLMYFNEDLTELHVMENHQSVSPKIYEFKLVK